MSTSNTTSNVLSVANMNRGARAVVAKTSAMSQVLRQFETLYSVKLPECKGLTVEQFMSAMGVERSVKNGKKGKYTPGTIRAGWNVEMLTETGQMCAYKWVRGTYLHTNGKRYPVYVRNIERNDIVICKRYMLKQIADDKWSVYQILRGLRQGLQLQKNQDVALISELEFNEFDGRDDTHKCYIYTETETIEVSYKDVEF